jgi:hypothetical protein
MLSNPMDVGNDSVSALFPSAVLPVYGYSRVNGFEQAGRIPPGRGYWMKFDTSSSIGIFGDILDSITVPLDSGWNILGSVTNPLPAGAIVQNPPANILSLFYGYNNGYFPADTIQPGKAYWVKAGHPGIVTLSAASSGNIDQSPYRLLAGMNTLKLTDASGKSQTLYFGASDTPDGKLLASSLPALPDAVFDARFEGGELIKTYSTSNESSVEYPIVLTGVEKPVVVKWKLANTTSNRIGIFSENEIPLLADNHSQTEGEIRINSTGNRLILRIIPVTEIPSRFRLDQNYPNPFNPITVIRYSLSVNSYVTLKLYDVLGREVRTLVNELQEAGYKSVKLDAGGLASGVYTYRLTAGKFTGTKKMVLVK